MTVAIVADARVRALNRKLRRKDKATDVLSFPAAAVSARRASAPQGDGGHLGDVVIAAGVAARQAREAGHTLGIELRVLALHGLLHLLGYDHEHDDGRMARLERRLRRRGGLREGLIEREGRDA
jgi:probable rRNA maturation factor